MVSSRQRNNKQKGKHNFSRFNGVSDLSKMCKCVFSSTVCLQSSVTTLLTAFFQWSIEAAAGMRDSREHLALVSLGHRASCGMGGSCGEWQIKTSIDRQQFI